MKRFVESAQSFVARHLLLVLILMAFGNAGIAAGVYATYGSFIFTVHPAGASLPGVSSISAFNDEAPQNGLAFNVPGGSTYGYSFEVSRGTVAEITAAGTFVSNGAGLPYINAQGTALATPHHEDGFLAIALLGTCAADTYNCGVSSGYTFTFKTPFLATPYCWTTNYGTAQMFPSISLVTTTYATVGESNPYSSTISGAISNFVHCEGQ